MKRLLTLGFTLLELIALTAVYAYAWFEIYFERVSYRLNFYPGGLGHRGTIVIYFFLLIFALHTYGGGILNGERSAPLILSQTFGILFANFITYLQLCLMSMWMVRVIPILLMTVVQFLIVVLFVLVYRGVYRRLVPPDRLLVIYGEYPIGAILEKLRTRQDRFRIEKTINLSEGMQKLEQEVLGKRDNGESCEAKKTGTAAALQQERKYDAVVLWDLPNKERNDLLKLCYGQSIRVYLMPKITDVIVKGMLPLHLFDTPILLSDPSPLTLEEKAAKRLLDLVFSLILGILASPFMLLTAFAVKLCDGGPVFYRQKRVTLGGREFEIIKFRSMRVSSEADGIARLAGKKDDRITPVGRFIRAVRLDELPQLWNIFKGEMSFIGPRPERPELIAQYLETMPEFAFRTRVKAGLAGYAQVYGKYNTTPYDKLKLDLYYIENYSFWLDLQLMLLTLKILFTPDATEGVEEKGAAKGSPDAAEASGRETFVEEQAVDERVSASDASWVSAQEAFAEDQANDERGGASDALGASGREAFAEEQATGKRVSVSDASGASARETFAKRQPDNGNMGLSDRRQKPDRTEGKGSGANG